MYFHIERTFVVILSGVEKYSTPQLLKLFCKYFRNQAFTHRLSGLLTGHVKVLFSAKSTQKLSAAPLASKGSAEANAVDTATAKAELSVNGCYYSG
ncbi:hypothetical protein FYC62_15345 [Pedobacter aquae]|uniref:Uncharacterized protein n=1 Tax=Pedobacter aquae TaxID=2605747 RepID=A0A5C0VMP6_9SPHI|nr:hypothetical protein [Pedobacter aquae]QEK52891.1 hypothetical protein FYC62_15345 [Pedobacter aquae]